MRPAAPAERDAMARAAALYGAGRLEEAQGLAEAILAASPRHFFALHLLATIALRQGRAEDCVELATRALELDGRNVDVLCNRGIARRMLERPQAALEDYDRALASDPRSFKAHTLRGVTLDALGRPDEALAAYDRALAIHPGYASARYNRGLQRLARGDFEAGWDGYELRFTTDPPTSLWRTFGLPRLGAGDFGSGKRVAVWREQGIGDQILFSTLLPELRSRGVKPVVEVDPRMLDAFRRSLPDVEFAAPEEAPRAFASCELEVPIGSLPALLRRDAESFAGQPGALLAPDPERVREMRQRLGSGVVGISWRSFQSAKRRLYAASKSVPLERFAALARGGRRLLDLQYGDVSAERSGFDARHPGALVHLEDLDTYNDLEGMLAAIEACERVVTVSNATAHFAGAIGKRTTLVYLSARAPFHYWVPGPDGRCPWYPCVEIATDPAWDSWDVALEAIAERMG